MTTLDGSSVTDGGTIITVPSGVTWYGSIQLSASLSGTIGPAKTAIPNVGTATEDLVILSLSTPALLSSVGSGVADAVTFQNLVVPGPASITLQFGGATVAAAVARGITA